MKVIYKPFGLILGIVAGLAGQAALRFRVDEDRRRGPAEGARRSRRRWSKILAAAALQGVIFKTTRVVVDRYGAQGWYYLTGAWPGEKRPDPETSRRPAAGEAG